ncbi:MAG: bifunctional phosphopantothenoylcysteine decarboxylase/phosphopantothenate--cysteine ligase CoaBC [Acidimicrobiales bacterium]
MPAGPAGPGEPGWGQAPDAGGPLAGRRVVLGVSGGIAAYKAVEVCRLLVGAGAHVVPVMTRAALRFLGPATLSALASEPVRTSMWDGPEPIPHTHLGRRADLVLVVPATARVIGSYTAGISDDLLTATLLATRAPVVICPAMHTEMWDHPAVVDNVATLRRRGVAVVGPATGALAGGDEGHGRLADPATILAAAVAALAPSGDLEGRTALVTAGGTREPVDPVRFLGNRSSGKQGHAIAAELARRGAQVVLVTTAAGPVTTAAGPVTTAAGPVTTAAGPVTTAAGLVTTGITIVAVETAAEMHDAVVARAAGADVVVLAAAVADFRPRAVAGGKLRRSDGVPDLVLEPTPDIAAALTPRRRRGQVLVGFAAETAGGEALVGSALAKLRAKHLDLVVANDVSAPGAGFDHDTNDAVIVDGTRVVPTGLVGKAVVARAVVDAVTSLLSPRIPATGPQPADPAQPAPHTPPTEEPT